MRASLPVMALTMSGVAVMVLGLFVAGDMIVVIVGLAALTVVSFPDILGETFRNHNSISEPTAGLRDPWERIPKAVGCEVA